MLSVLGFILLYLGTANSFLAMNLGTCTQHAADELGGGIISLALYLFGVACLAFARPRKTTYLAALPIAVLTFWQLLFTFRLAHGYLVKGLSACAILHEPGYEMDGREMYFIGLWTCMCLVLVFGLAFAFHRARSNDG